MATAVMTSAVFLLAFIHKPFSKRQELRDSNYLLVGPQIKQTRILEKTQLPEEHHPICYSHENMLYTRGMNKNDGVMRKPELRSGLDDAEYSMTVLDDKCFVRIYEKNAPTSRMVIFDYDVCDFKLPRKLNGNEIACLELIAERELQTIEQQIYDDYRDGVNSKYKTVTYKICPFTRLRLEYNIKPMINY